VRGRQLKLLQATAASVTQRTQMSFGSFDSCGCNSTNKLGLRASPITFRGVGCSAAATARSATHAQQRGQTPRQREERRHQGLLNELSAPGRPARCERGAGNKSLLETVNHEHARCCDRNSMSDNDLISFTGPPAYGGPQPPGPPGAGECWGAEGSQFSVQTARQPKIAQHCSATALNHPCVPGDAGGQPYGAPVGGQQPGERGGLESRRSSWQCCAVCQLRRCCISRL